MKTRYSLRTMVLRGLSLATVASMALTSSTEFPHALEASVINSARQSSNSATMSPPSNNAINNSPDRNADNQHYVVGMHLSFTTDIKNPVLHMVLLKQDDRSQLYSIQIESSQPVSFEGDAMLMLEP